MNKKGQIPLIIAPAWSLFWQYGVRWIVLGLGTLFLGFPLFKSALTPNPAPVIPWYAWLIIMFIILLIFRRRK